VDHFINDITLNDSRTKDMMQIHTFLTNRVLAAFMIESDPKEPIKDPHFTLQSCPKPTNFPGPPIDLVPIDSLQIQFSNPKTGSISFKPRLQRLHRICK